MNVSLLYNFFLGETSPLVAARIDSEAQQMGASRMENFIPMTAGGLRKRPGTWFDGTAPGKARLKEWLLSDCCLLLELTENLIRIWKLSNDKYQVIQEIATTYTEDQLQHIHYASSKNTMWLVHREHRPLTLKWDGSAVAVDEPIFTGTVEETDFHTEGNYPATVAFDSGRLCFAGTENNPNRIYLSMAPDSMNGTDRYTDFTTANEEGLTTSAHAIILEENDMHGSRIQWIAANKNLLAATERATWSDNGEIPTPSTFDMNIVEHAGANEIQAKGTKEIIVYAGRTGKTLRALVWNENGQGGGYIDMDISERAAHLFTAGIKDFAVMDYPYPLIWIVTGDGQLVSCLINMRSGIIAYSRHPTDGQIESIAVLPEVTGDVLFLQVNRGTWNMEHLTLEELVTADFGESHYVDAGERLVFNTATKTITGLTRFANKTIRVFADGAIEPPVKVDENGEAELQHEAMVVHLGLSYKSAFTPNARQLPANGTSLGKKRRVEKVILHFYKSLGGKAGASEDKTTNIITMRYGSYEPNTAPEPFTGEYDITVSGNIDTEGKLVIVHEEPTPFTILALVQRVAVMEA